LKPQYRVATARNKLVKLILQEVVEIIIEVHGVDNMNQSIQDIIEEVKYVQNWCTSRELLIFLLL
jgi:broad-specificity NMP kinase